MPNFSHYIRSEQQQFQAMNSFANIELANEALARRLCRIEMDEFASARGSQAIIKGYDMFVLTHMSKASEKITIEPLPRLRLTNVPSPKVRLARTQWPFVNSC
jgi:hypothetical protein